MDTDHKVWANAVDALACGIAAISPDGKILTANRAWREFWGDAGTDFSKLIDDALPGADAEAVAQSMAGVVAGGPEFATEFAHGHAPEQRWVRLQISRLADDPPQALACLTDITDLCEDRDTPAASEAKFKALYEATGDAVMLFEDGRMVDCNPASAQLLGFERMENVLGLHPWEFSPELQPNGRRSEDLAL